MATLPNGSQNGKRVSMRPPPPPGLRPGYSRTVSAAPILTGRTSPADSIASSVTTASRARSPNSQNAGSKRKERDFDQDAAEETNINVVVRCRGRNDREVKENSAVVVSTDGVKGKVVELSMGPNAISNKTYHFDKVFSPAADQNMVFDEVVTPILNEVLSGFNCTIFAYGQTGTGKTYTMSGDTTDTQPLPDAAGLVPRALYSLFDKLASDEAESSVKCSFIELYNEELRDLLSSEENAKLKIFEDTSRKGQTSTLVQGMEECHIKSASRGIQLLREGNHKRHVAATRCNDLSSRSHTVFTITVYLKRTSEAGEDFVSAGKLNLVDLAGSENIQRSGAENKRAVEAGLINKSLLTLGRVINALVDKSSHIPYRESKLTRLLQDSLGGRTKTCIIATLSPAKSNLEETISTLDYAFRAKNIRNKPQINQMVSKKTLLREFTNEIEKLKGELIAARHRNGVYLSQEGYEEMVTESESRRILSEEQKDKIVTMEVNLRNKLQELFSLTNSFNGLKKENESVKMILEGTNSLLEKTEVVLFHTRQNLAEETVLRKAHQQTEEVLENIGGDLISTLNKTTSDISGLHSKLRRRSELHSRNRVTWGSSRNQVYEGTRLVETRLEAFQERQEELVATLSSRLRDFVEVELEELTTSEILLQSKTEGFEELEVEVQAQTEKARDSVDSVLRDMSLVREKVKEKVGRGLKGLSATVERIYDGTVTELEAFHTQLHSSYSSLGKDVKATFDELVRQLSAQKSEADDLKRQLSEVGAAAISANAVASTQLATIMAQEKEQSARERETLISQISSIIKSTGEAQDKRLESKITSIQHDLTKSNGQFEKNQATCVQSLDAWMAREKALVDDVLTSRESVKAKLRNDWNSATSRTSAIQSTTRSAHSETLDSVERQMEQMDSQLQALDDVVSRLRAQNTTHHITHVSSLGNLTASVKQSYNSIGEHLTTSVGRVHDLAADLLAKTSDLQETLPPLQQTVRDTFHGLREDLTANEMWDYSVTGETPVKMQYLYPTTLPRTEDHTTLLSRLRSGGTMSASEGAIDDDEGVLATASPRKAEIFVDNTEDAAGDDNSGATITLPILPSTEALKPRPESRGGTGGALTEIAVNVINSDPNQGLAGEKVAERGIPPPLKRHSSVDSKLPMKLRGTATKGTRITMAMMLEERENASPAELSRNLGSARRPRSDRGA